MRKIKFRIWSEQGQGYHEKSYDLDFPLYIDIEGNLHHFISSDNGDLRPISVENNLGNTKIQQYTGLKDKNGKEIYEGDIVETDKDNFYQVMYGEYTFYSSRHEYFESVGFYLYNISKPEYKDEFRYWILDSGMSLEVKGNIYENPELLEKYEN